MLRMQVQSRVKKANEGGRTNARPREKEEEEKKKLKHKIKIKQSERRVLR